MLARLPLLPVNDGESPAGSGSGGLLEEGVFLASRHLEQDTTLTGRARQSRRAYELRARWRPTPHGVFAGVALATVAVGPTRLQMGTEHRARTNPSSSWLAELSSTLLQGPSRAPVLRRLTLLADSTAVRRAGRWEIESPSPGGSNGTTIERCTVRATAVTDLVMSTCAQGCTGQAVLAAVTARWPQAPEHLVIDTLAQLTSLGFLLTDILAGDVNADPIGQILRALPPVHPARAPLTRLRTALDAADAHVPGSSGRREALVAARDLADGIRMVQRPLTVDVALDARCSVRPELVTSVAETAGVLWRVADRGDHTGGFRRRFVERYGRHRYVPLLEAADPVTGIGMHTSHETGPGRDRERAAVLNGLIAKALTTQSLEVELDDAAIAALTGPDTMAPPTADAFVRLVADREGAAVPERPQALRVFVAGCISPAAATLARFSTLLDHHHAEPVEGTALLAELAVRARVSSTQSAAPTTGFTTHRIPVGVVGGGKHDLQLGDLLLIDDGTDVRVWSAALDRQVLPVLYSRLAPDLLPPIAQLLHALGSSGSGPWSWSWSAAPAPFHPRIRYRDTILSSARWALPPPLIDAARDPDQWENALQIWRTRTIPAPPPIVLTDDHDRQLPLTLNHPDDRHLLRRYVRRGLAGVRELPGGQDATSAVAAGPGGPHLVELVVPLIRHARPAPVRHRAPLPARSLGEGLFQPGGPWLSLAIPTEPHLQDDVLRGLAELARAESRSWDSWFWLRYRTELGHHLRVRFHGRPDALGGRLLPALGTWARTRHEQRLIGRMVVECYEQEIERYGGTEATVLAEQVFAADSDLVVSLLGENEDDRVAVAARVAATIARTVAGADLAALDGRHLDRAARQTMNRLRPRARACESHHDALRPEHLRLLATLEERLTAYCVAVPTHLRVRCASSLIHMHANRALPLKYDEPILRALAADLLSRA